MAFDGRVVNTEEGERLEDALGAKDIPPDYTPRHYHGYSAPIHPTALMKAKKNPVEIENIRKAQIKDSTAHVRFMKWLKENDVH